MRLLISEVEDRVIRENLRRVETEYNDNTLVKGQFKFFEVTFGNATASYPLAATFVHRLGFTPKDVLPTSIIGGTVTWDYSSFDGTQIYVTVSAQTTVRFFLGRYEEGVIQ